MKRNLILVTVMMLIVAIAIGGSTFGAAKRFRLVLSFHDPAIEWAQPMKSGMADAAKEFGFDASFIGPAGIDAARQIEQVKTLVEQGLVDGLAITAIDPSYAPLISELIAKNIPVVTVCNDDPKSKRLAFYGQTAESFVSTAYESTMEFCKTVLRGRKGEVAILNCLPEIRALIDRCDGSRMALKEFPNLTVLPGMYTKGMDLIKIYSDIESLLTAHPKIIGLIATEACNTPTAAHVIRDKKLQKRVQLSGYDVTKESVELVSDGSLDILVGCFPYKQGYLSMKGLYEYLAKGIKPVSVELGAEMITPRNVGPLLKSMGITK